MTSHNFGKDVVCNWIRENFDTAAEILDVGAGREACWRNWLRDYPNMDAVEIFTPNANGIRTEYREVFNVDICDFKYGKYDLIIFGDVIEHLTIEQAQSVLKYASTRCHDMIVAVPFLYHQDPIYGNQWERHIQDDLTAELFAERYKGFKVLHDTGRSYVYYHKGEQK